ncbi:MAG: sugar phosphate nucleotidyltransferase [Clostridia bacterium]
MNKPVLVVLAAGMGSRYGGMKQIDPVGPNNQLIIDYSIYDAKRAGFETVVFIIKHEIEDVFKEAIGNRLEKFMNVKYAFQNIADLPKGFEVPECRKKPWGTAHAVLSARDVIDSPFVVINADDFYGAQAFKLAYDFLINTEDDEKYRYCMVGYKLKNTVTDNGSVSRGVCVVDSENNLSEIVERKRIEKMSDGIKFTEDDGKSWTNLSDDTAISMNLFGFKKNIIDESMDMFAEFLSENLEKDPEKCEFFIPLVVSELMNKNKATIKVLETSDKWYGVTYQEDKPTVQKAMRDMADAGLYPENLWK